MNPIIAIFTASIPVTFLQIFCTEFVLSINSNNDLIICFFFFYEIYKIFKSYLSQILANTNAAIDELFKLKRQMLIDFMNYCIEGIETINTNIGDQDFDDVDETDNVIREHVRKCISMVFI